MHVCDITRSDEAIGTVRITIPSTLVDEDSIVNEYEVGQAALDAFLAGDWAKLNQLTPVALRKKDPRRAAAAKKAGATRSANSRSAKEAAQAAQGGAPDVAGAVGAAAASEGSASATGAPEDETF